MRLTYRNHLFRTLRDQLVDSTTAEQRLLHAGRAESLLRELDDARVYPYGYYHFRITNSRPEVNNSVTIAAEDARHDIRLLVEDISDSANISAESVPEQVWTVDQLSEMLRVSTKTISRWREHGLVGRRFVFHGRKRLGFLKSSVDHFVLANAGRVRRGTRFRHLTDQERTSIVEQARSLAGEGERPTEAMKEIARRTGRSLETIRYTIQKFDRQHAENLVFGTSALSQEAKQRIYGEYQRGATIESLARRYRQNRGAIDRLLREMRVQRVLALPLEYMPSRDFTKPDAEQDILAPLPRRQSPRSSSRRPGGIPSYLASLYEVPLLSRDQEVHLFRKYNYLKFRAARLRRQLNPQCPQSRLMDQIEKLHDQAVATKNLIIQSNLRLVVSIAKRYVGHQDSFFDLISDGNLSLMRAVEKFDYTRGNKFSTYASWAVKKNYARTFVTQLRHQDRFRTSQEELLELKPEYRANPYQHEHAYSRQKSEVGSILGCLDERERRIVTSRFGLNPGEEPKTLKEVGTELGVSKERIRQIETRAISKLRQAAATERIEVPA